MDTDKKVRKLIYESLERMNDRDFNGYLDLCDAGYVYTITAYSPEIRKEMIWLQHDKEGMATLFKNLPRHNSDKSQLTRHANVYDVEVDTAGEEAVAKSNVQIFRTQNDGGATDLYAVARITDRVRLEAGEPRLLSRQIKLDTRQLGIGHHIPF